MPNTVQLTQNGQPVYPVTDVSLITGLEERSGMRVIPYTTRPTASAETAGFIYMDESTKDLYITKATSGSYSWVSAGNLSNIDLDKYAKETELKQLGQEVDDLIPTVFEDGFFIVDTSGNIGFRVDENGITELILSVLSALFTTTIEDGFYIIDSNRNIGFMVNTSGAHSANLVEY